MQLTWLDWLGLGLGLGLITVFGLGLALDLGIALSGLGLALVSLCSGLINKPALSPHFYAKNAGAQKHAMTKTMLIGLRIVGKGCLVSFSPQSSLKMSWVYEIILGSANLHYDKFLWTHGAATFT